MPNFTGETLALCLAASLSAGVSAHPLMQTEQLGKSIFFDQRLSVNENLACASCHAPGAGWTGPDSETNAHGAAFEGSIAGRFGNRKPPSAAYATPSPVLYYMIDGSEALFVGGNFWDGRATGEKLGNPAADQAQGPFLNPVEQGLPDSACVVHKVCTAPDYPVSFEQVWGYGACDIAWPADIDTACADPEGSVSLSSEDRAKANAAYDQVALSIAAFEDSKRVNRFSSKYDAYLAGKVQLSPAEARGLQLFRGKAKCVNCHVAAPGPDGRPPLFTDFTFDNLGLPKNPENPWYTMPAMFNPDGENWLDEGLGGYLETRLDYAAFAPENYGKQKVPTLRNVDKRPWPGFVKAYGHNGYFKSLKGIVHFYNTRDVKPRCADPEATAAQALADDCWPAPEVPANVNTTELGDLGLSDAEEDAIVAFLRTLTDGFLPGPRHGH
jgi:cytochrome c peroxidase